MIKLSEIIRKKTEGEEIQNKPGLISEVIEIKKAKESLPEIKKLYEDAILEINLIMNDIREGKNIEGKEIAIIAEIFVNRLCVAHNTLLSLVNIFPSYKDQKDYLYEHSVNCSILAASIGLALGFDKNELIDLFASSLLHDIGMLKIPQEIIKKPSKLTKEEYDLIRKHPIYGLELLNNIKYAPKSAHEVIHQHHERIDGSGYPEGKRGEEISEYGKIVALAEFYEAVTHSRPYRMERYIPYDALKMIIQDERDSFDPKYVRVFLDYITPYPPGSFVLLNNNEIGKVISINEKLPQRPIVEIFFDVEGKPPEKPRRIDLSKSPILFIKEAVNGSYL